MDEVTQKWLKEQRREDLIAEILYNGKRTSLSDLKKIGWTNGFPVSVQALFTLGSEKTRSFMDLPFFFEHVLGSIQDTGMATSPTLLTSLQVQEGNDIATEEN